MSSSRVPLLASTPHWSDGASMASAHSLPEDVLARAFQYALDIRHVFAIAVTCSRWSKLVLKEECWRGCEVMLWGLDIPLECLRRWSGSWRMAKTILLSHAEYVHLHARQLQSRISYMVWHKWGQWELNSPTHWHLASWPRLACLVCMTKEDISGDLSIYQIGKKFSSEVMLGWTSARSPRALAMMISRSRRQERRSTDFVLALELRPSQAERNGGSQDATPENVAYYSEHEDLFAHLSFCREEGRVDVATSASGLMSASFPSGLPSRSSSPLCFFIAIPWIRRTRSLSLPEAQLVRQIN